MRLHATITDNPKVAIRFGYSIRQKDRKTERQKDRKTERQKDRQTERQKHIKRFGYSIRFEQGHKMEIFFNADCCRLHGT